jgi:protocatechuate 3,4-dioxygenase beta subunit
MAKSDISRRYFLNASVAAAVVTLLPTSSIAKEYKATAKQIEGPFFPRHKQADKNADMTQVDKHNGHAVGEVLYVSGRVLDTNGNPVKGAIIDIWQADRNGRYLHDDAPESSPLDPNFQYWAQLKTDDEGNYRVKTIKPGKYPAMDDWVRPPHIHFKVARRGLKELTTQMYFANEPLNDIDKLYLATPENDRHSIVVEFENGKGQFDIVLEKIG